MAEKTVCISQQQTKPIRILKWKVREGNTIAIGRIILLYDFLAVEKTEQRKLKATQAGTVHKIIAQEGAIVKPGASLFELKKCSHPTIMNDMCAECGADLRKDQVKTTASVPMVHSIPELKVSEELAQKLGKADNERLIKDRKLVLLVDLDQTLIHTTNDNIPPNIKDVYHFQLHGPHSPWYHTRLRPGTHRFLHNICKHFELHICTFGARNYAHTIAMFLDTDQTFFSNRILSRDECFDPTSKKANLKALFPCGDNMVCIIDDREDVWSHATNLIHVKPYHFFRHTGDINAPPGLEKVEDDDKAGIDLTKIVDKIEHDPNDEVKSLPNGKHEEDLEKENVDVSGSKIEQQSIVKSNSKQDITSGVHSCTINTVPKEEKPKVAAKMDTAARDERDIERMETESNEKLNSENGGKREIEKMETENEEQSTDDKLKGNGKTLISDRKIEKVASTNGEKEVTNNSKTIEFNKEAVVNIKKAKEEGTQEVKVDNNNKILNGESKEENNASFKNGHENSPKDTENMIVVEDPDDYLIYLEDILRRIHAAFYEEFDQMESGDVPDLKQVIPSVRSHVLKGFKLAFSGLVPTHIKLEQSKAYLVARSLGATVTQDLEEDTTHLVAVRPGTAKVNAGRRKKNVKIVTPDWLWSCAERWEHVDERIFPLKSKGSKNRHPPPHCSSPEHHTNYPVHENPALRKRTASGRFMDTINPLMSFSSADIADMDKEVEDILDDASESSESEGEKNDKAIKAKILKEDPESSSSEDSLTGEYPKGHKRKRCNEDTLAEDLRNSTEEDESPSIKFRRGDVMDSEFEFDQESQDSENSMEAPDEVDDGEWNMMGAALEREFLSNN